MKHIISVFSAVVALLCASTGLSFENAFMTDSHNQLKKSTDGGKTWQIVSAGQARNQNIPAVVKPSVPSFKAVVVKNGKRTTTDGGKTWNTESDDNLAAPATRFSVYPNPVNGRSINIRINQELKGKSFDISLCDICGSCLMTRSISNTMSESGVITLDLGNLHGGFYIVRISSYFGDDMTGVLIM